MFDETHITVQGTRLYFQSKAFHVFLKMTNIFLYAKTTEEN